MAEGLLTLLVLKTRRVERLRTFYSALGIELAKEQHRNGPIHYTGRVGEGQPWWRPAPAYCRCGSLGGRKKCIKLALAGQ